MHAKQVASDIFFPTVEIKEFNVIIDGKNIFDQPVATGQLQLVKGMIIQLVVYWIMFISKIVMK